MAWLTLCDRVPGRVLIAVFDTSALFSDLSMSGVQSRQLLRWSGHGSYELHLPEVVVAEMTHDARERIEKAVEKVAAARTSFAKLAIPVELPLPDVSVSTGEFEERLRARIAGTQGQVLPIPDAPHAKLVERSADGIKPFSSSAKDSKEHSDRGYRDTLIWITVLEAAKAGEVTLVTENTTDFTDGEGNLHPDLLADLEREGLEGEVQLSLSLTAFLAEHLPSDATAIEEFRLRVAGNDEFREELDKGVSKLLAEPQDWMRADVDFVRLSDPSRKGEYRPETAEVSVSRLGEIETRNAYGFGGSEEEDDSGVIELEVRAELDVDLVFDRGDAEWITEYGADVELYDWEETFVPGRITISVLARVNLVFDRDSGAIAELEVVDVKDLPAEESV